MPHSFSRKRTSSSEKEDLAGLVSRTITDTYDDLFDIIDARIELVKIELTAKLATVAALLITAAILFAGIIYLIAAVALLIGELLGHYYLGYLIVSAVFLLTGLFLTKIRPDVLKNLIQTILLSSHGTGK
ncbi:phage holin family protein [Prosthecochloris sp. N3]|uniref:Phage holin family protein n=1 Tax=Prosthecochloris ethylica TaxID=2743976 RepID=A0ABR9XTZ4_9CHLB|nr:MULTISPECIES: phage holin family protein [Prosthecochloris]MEC9485950.1 phage holin family protein [Prosthecochloris sp.]MBF0586572.1 phage holin family protein [Prosthecochloris ethylica]MBF0637531.1 phage holin family protein [Prosthecochloris ethylica]NUK47680.1 phage holin family protein [Prosthecochloris ethylica]RNA64347.1 phage holin family protein [Prosthecochloris sp. ZM_2]